MDGTVRTGGLDDLTARLEALERAHARMAEELAALGVARAAAPSPPRACVEAPSPQQRVAVRTSRRGMLRAGLGAAAAVGVAALAGARPGAALADGTEAATTFTSSNSTSTVVVANTGSGEGLNVTASTATALHALAPGTSPVAPAAPAAVYAQGGGAADAISAFSVGGTGIRVASLYGGVAMHAQTAAHSGQSGTVIEAISDGNGLALDASSGYGDAIRAASGGGFGTPDGGAGVAAVRAVGDNGADGVAAFSTGGVGVGGESRGAYSGVLGTSAGYNGVTGKANGTAGAGVSGLSALSYGGSFQGGKAAIYLVPSSSAGAPTSGSHATGELLVDQNGALLICVVGGTPGTWRQVVTRKST